MSRLIKIVDRFPNRISCRQFTFLCFVISMGNFLSAEVPQLKAVAEDRLIRSFVVDERSIRGLNNALRIRMLEQAPDFVAHYTVTLSNQSYYETQDLDLVLKDENISRKKIVALEFFMRAPLREINFNRAKPEDRRKLLETMVDEILNGSGPTITLKLTSDDMRYSIRGPSRDWVFNTQNDVLDQLARITRRNYGLTKYIPTAGVIGGLVGFLLLSFLSMRRYNAVQLKTDPKFAAISLWDYIFTAVDPFWKSGMRMPMALIACVGLGYLVSKAFSALVNFLFPTATFAIGDQIRVHEEILKLRENIVWGVIATLLLGFLAAVGAHLLMNRNQKHSR